MLIPGLGKKFDQRQMPERVVQREMMPLVRKFDRMLIIRAVQKLELKASQRQVSELLHRTQKAHHQMGLLEWHWVQLVR